MPLVWAQGRPAGFQGISSFFRVPSASAGSARSAGQAVRWLRGNMRLRCILNLDILGKLSGVYKHMFQELRWNSASQLGSKLQPSNTEKARIMYIGEIHLDAVKSFINVPFADVVLRANWLNVDILFS